METMKIWEVVEQLYKDSEKVFHSGSRVKAFRGEDGHLWVQYDQEEPVIMTMNLLALDLEWKELTKAVQYPEMKFETTYKLAVGSSGKIVDYSTLYRKHRNGVLEVQSRNLARWTRTHYTMEALVDSPLAFVEVVEKPQTPKHTEGEI